MLPLTAFVLSRFN